MQLRGLLRWAHFYNYFFYINWRQYQTGPLRPGFLSLSIVSSGISFRSGFFPVWGSLPCFVKSQFGPSLAGGYIWAVVSSHGLMNLCEVFNIFGYIFFLQKTAGITAIIYLCCVCERPP